MGSHGKPSLKHHANPSLWASFKVAWSGLFYGLKNERNLQIHAVITCSVLILASWLSLSWLEWGILFLAIGLVWCLELVNSAIEATVDLVVGEQLHPVAKVAKDLAASAVVVAAITAVMVGLFLFGPRLLVLLGWLP